MTAILRCFVFVEGDDDERFFDHVVRSKLETRYSVIQVWKYAQKSPSKVNNFLRTIALMRAEYVFLADLNGEPCVTAKKTRLQERYQCIDTGKIMIVCREIESWYLAGIDKTIAKRLKIALPGSTDNVGKEKFESLMPKRFPSRVDFMVEVLKQFSVDFAGKRNQSFRYFISKYV